MYAQRPDRVGNLDESGIQGQCRATRSFIKNGRSANRIDSGLTRDTETIVSTSFANGKRPPLLFSLKGQKTKERLLQHAPPGTAHVFMGEKAYQTQESWKATLEHLKKTIPGGVSPQNRFLLLVDGHASRVSVENVRMACGMGIDILVFPGHLTYYLQPEDQVFGAFKAVWRGAMASCLLRNKGKMMSRPMYLGKVCDAWVTTLT